MGTDQPDKSSEPFISREGELALYENGPIFPFDSTALPALTRSPREMGSSMPFRSTEMFCKAVSGVLFTTLKITKAEPTPPPFAFACCVLYSNETFPQSKDLPPPDTDTCLAWDALIVPLCQTWLFPTFLEERGFVAGDSIGVNPCIPSSGCARGSVGASSAVNPSRSSKALLIGWAAGAGVAVGAAEEVGAPPSDKIPPKSSKSPVAVDGIEAVSISSFFPFFFFSFFSFFLFFFFFLPCSSPRDSSSSTVFSGTTLCSLRGITSSSLSGVVRSTFARPLNSFERAPRLLAADGFMDRRLSSLSPSSSLLYTVRSASAAVA
mmetsp:Transcript_12005/g.17766  ORF Transcript_12005/g.17766 Transcript_12005/m.17766 type:complete len:322 (-) Transcript_12005:811-1776(-)